MGVQGRWREVGQGRSMRRGGLVDACPCSMQRCHAGIFPSSVPALHCRHARTASVHAAAPQQTACSGTSPPRCSKLWRCTVQMQHTHALVHTLLAAHPGLTQG